MPAFARGQGGLLTDAQVKALAEGIKPRWGKPPTELEESAPPYRSQGRGSVERGQKVFQRACAVCHGSQGEGFEKEGRVVRRINDPAFLALISDQALRRLVITGRPDLGMPNYAGPREDNPDFKPLTATEVSDLVALLSSWAPKRPGHGKEQEHRPAGPADGHP
jgi:cytochrome c oxidase cbb3-type subunit 3